MAKKKAAAIKWPKDHAAKHRTAALLGWSRRRERGDMPAARRPARDEPAAARVATPAKTRTSSEEKDLRRKLKTYEDELAFFKLSGQGLDTAQGRYLAGRVATIKEQLGESPKAASPPLKAAAPAPKPKAPPPTPKAPARTFNPQDEAAGAYVRAIHNKDKQDYARAYVSYLQGKRATRPDRPKGLGVMGEQDVWFSLRKIYGRL